MEFPILLILLCNSNLFCLQEPPLFEGGEYEDLAGFEDEMADFNESLNVAGASNTETDPKGETSNTVGYFRVSLFAWDQLSGLSFHLCILKSI